MKLDSIKQGDKVRVIATGEVGEVIGIIGSTVLVQHGDDCEGLEADDLQDPSAVPVNTPAPTPAPVVAAPIPAPTKKAVTVKGPAPTSTAETMRDRAVLMRFSAGWPGQEREDRALTEEIKKDKALGKDAGNWDKNLFPKRALSGIISAINALRTEHNRLTWPYDRGTGILAAGLIERYGAFMKEGREKVKGMIETQFLANPIEWIVWAMAEHNGTFEPRMYPGCNWKDPNDHAKGVDFDADVFRAKMREKFYITTEPSPVPCSQHFAETIGSLLGTDVASVDQRVADAERAGKVEVMSRLLQPVRHMIEVLSKDDPRIFKTLTEGIKEICEIAPHLNIDGDPQIAAAIKAVSALARYDKGDLKKEAGRKSARAEAEALMKRLSGYKV